MIDKASARLLNEIESKEWLGQAGIPVHPAYPAKNLTQALAISRELGYPVVMKIISPDIAHKSDAGGVKLNLTSAAGVKKAYREIRSSVKAAYPNAVIEGISLQKMASPGLELILGMNQDPQFGPVMMFGLGGVLVEIYRDIAFRLIPLSRRDAVEMVREIRGYPLLEGYRGREGVDLTRLENLILDLSRFIEANPQVQELDLNPVFGYRDKLLAVDARIVIR